ncbi:fluoride efflux transporter CrcB [Mesorhizobium xinjiangense]|uniref:fluoride efflux transporter CrcB n=1 Tax=Mesorhizobium xinjiangense TaxID=2678685 RepID=UPI0012ED6515|nr:fluoride efflux transporter CrcB [Mesorhizobium xinjiangense]
MAVGTELLLGLIWIAVGSALGGMARFFVSGLVGRRIGETFPWGTMAVNVSGAFAIGAAAAAATGGVVLHEPGAWGLAATGFLGCYTTVSSFSLQTLALARDGDWLLASLNVTLSLVLGLCAVALGFAAIAAMIHGA